MNMHVTSRTLGIAALIVAVIGSGSCAGTEDATSVADAGAARMPPRIKIASANVGGSYFPMGNAIAQVLSTKVPGLLATDEASGGSSQNIRMLDGRQIDFGLSNASITFPAILGGSDGFDKPYPVRAVMTLHSSVNLFIALKKSGIRTIADMKGKRVSIGPAGGGWDAYTKPILAAHGLTFDDFTPVYEGQSSAVDMLTDGNVDAIFVGGSIPHATIVAATAQHDINFVEFDETALDRVKVERPTIRKYPIPANTYKGQSKDFWAVDAGAAQLITRADADPDFIYLITKTLYENREMIVQMTPAGKEITPERAGMDIGIPYHEGSLRYFKEINIWNPKPGSSIN
jgi:TRAP transporter TAXI family solute receptor